MRKNKTPNKKPSQNLPVLVGAARPRPSLSRVRIGANFVSQLIAAKAQMAGQRRKRRASTSIALGAYHDGHKITDQRMPIGYNRSISA